MDDATPKLCEYSGSGIIAEFVGRCSCGAKLTIRDGRFPWHSRGQDVVLPPEPTVEDSPTLAAHAEAAKWGYRLSSTEAACIAEAVLAASGLRETVVQEREANGTLLVALHQRPPVSPEVREALARTVMGALGCEMQDDTCDCEYPCAHKPYSYCETHDLDADDGAPCPKALVIADALLARFSVPSQPVYDEEKIARWLAYVASDWTHNDCGDDDHPFGHTNWQAWLDEAAALVAALRGGELTREETTP